MKKHWKKLLLLSSILWFLWLGLVFFNTWISNQTYAQTNTTGWVPGVDLRIKWEFAGFPSWTEDLPLIAQKSSPTITFEITNQWDELLQATNIAAGFLQCKRAETNINIYSSPSISNFVANPWVPQNISITLDDIFTQAVGSKTIICEINKDRLYYIWEQVITNNTRSGIVQVIETSRFDIAMERAIKPIKKNLEAPAVQWGNNLLSWPEVIKNFVYNKVMDVGVPLIIIVGILSAILGFYKMFFSTDDTGTQEWVKYIAYGLIGIIIIMSAKYIWTMMYEGIFFSWASNSINDIQWFDIAWKIYELLIYPFIKLAIYLVLGVMFIILAWRVLTFIFGSNDDTQKKAGTLIGRNIIAMLVIISAKQIVEAIYGKQKDIFKPISNLWEIGSGILADKNIPILYQVINRAMGLASLAVLIIIIFQTVQLLTKPDSPESMKSLKNSILYIFIGLLIIGSGYLITNFLIFN